MGRGAELSGAENSYRHISLREAYSLYKAQKRENICDFHILLRYIYNCNYAVCTLYFV